MQTQIATILREAADRIASIVEPAPTVPAPTVPAPFKLEAGKKYLNRTGKVVGPLEAYSWHATATYAFHFHGDVWTANGEWFKGSMNSRDLVAEYVEPERVPAKPTPNQEQVDELVAAAWEAFEYADSKDLVLGRLACALRPFASPVL